MEVNNRIEKIKARRALSREDRKVMTAERIKVFRG